MAISIDRNTIDHSGNTNTQMSEIALGLHDVATRVSEAGFDSYEGCIDKIVKSSRLYKLTDAGMDITEAIAVIGMNPGNVDLSESVIPKDQREALNEANHTQAHRAK